MAEKTASLVGIWSASVSQAALVEVIDRKLELGPVYRRYSFEIESDVAEKKCHAFSSIR